MYCQTSSSVQLDKGKTLMDSPFLTFPLYMFQSSGRWFFGSHWCFLSRNEYIRSLALDFSSSRLAPPNAASYPPASRAWRRDSVFITLVYMLEPWSKGLIFFSTPSLLICTMSSNLCFLQKLSRNMIMSLNFHVVSTWSRGKGRE